MVTVASSPTHQTPITDSLDRLRTLVSPYTGVVREVHRAFAAGNDARVVAVSAELADTRELSGHHLEANAGASHGLPEQALAAALGEAVERYSASYIPDQDLILASAEELGPAAVRPERFSLFHRNQYAGPEIDFEPFTSSVSVRWVQGFSLPDRERAFLPAQLVYLSGPSLARSEIPIGYPTSNGLACAATQDEAILAGLLEVVERDAFMLTWYGRLSLPRLDAAGDETLLELHRRHFAPAGLRYEVIDLSAFHEVPTALALVHGGETDQVALAVGAASAVEMQVAWQKSVFEAFAVRAWARALRLANPDRVFDADFSDVRSFEDHVLFYADPKHAVHASFLSSSAAVRRVDAVSSLDGARPSTWIRAVTDRLEKSGARAYAVDVTSPDARDAGLHVVKVVAPELSGLDVPHRARFLGGGRLYSAAWRRGLRPTPLSFDELNPYPHPFP